MSVKIKRSVYADMFGPTTGDRVRLADTDLIIEVEKDFTVYGEEVKFGGGKVIRDGMGQSQVTNRLGRAGRRRLPWRQCLARHDIRQHGAKSEGLAVSAIKTFKRKRGL